MTPTNGRSRPVGAGAASNDQAGAVSNTLRRPPLPAEFDDTLTALERHVLDLIGQTRDDRFRRRRHTLAKRHGHRLRFLVNRLEYVRGQIEPAEPGGDAG